MIKNTKIFIKKYFPDIVVEILQLLASLIFFTKNYQTIAIPDAFKDNFARCIYLLLKGKMSLISQAYFNTAYDWGKNNRKIVRMLDNEFFPVEEGCLLDAVNDLRVRTQVNFLAAIIKQYKIKRILETGTHKAMFCYVVHNCDRSIDPTPKN